MAGRANGNPGDFLLNAHHPSWLLFLYLSAATALFFCTCGDPFFWDTVQLASKHAHFFFNNGLHWQPLPAAIDSGHPPLTGFYVACLWTLFGKSLFVSHAAVFPFFLLNIGLLWRLGRQNRAWGKWLPLLVFADPVILTQHVLVSPDVILLSGALLALVGVLENKNLLLVTGGILLCLTSTRGMMTAAGLFVWAAVTGLTDRNEKGLVLKKLPAFLPGFFLAALFLIWHRNVVGWTGYHAGSPWAGAFQKVDFQGFMRNILVLAWRWLDMGRVAEIAAIGYLCWRLGWKASLARHRKWWLLLACLFLFLSPSALIYKGLSAHRYFMPAFLAAHLLVFNLLQEYAQSRRRAAGGILAGLLLLLVSGHGWVYPRGISVAWDCTLAHRSYYGLRQSATAFMDAHGIPWNETGTAFPNINTGENLQLDGDDREMAPKDFATNHYMLTSNIFNDFNPEDYARLESAEWEEIWEKHAGLVWMRLYRKVR